MSKQPIGWHEECLNNMRGYLKAREAELERLQDAIMRLQQDVAQKERQIAEAKRRGKDGFDGERFGLGRPELKA